MSAPFFLRHTFFCLRHGGGARRGIEVGSSSVRLPCCARFGQPGRLSPRNKIMTYDIAVIGGGIVGLSFAMQTTEKFPRLRVVVLEKEAGVAPAPAGRQKGGIPQGGF